MISICYSYSISDGGYADRARRTWAAMSPSRIGQSLRHRLMAASWTGVGRAYPRFPEFVT